MVLHEEHIQYLRDEIRNLQVVVKNIEQAWSHNDYGAVENDCIDIGPVCERLKCSFTTMALEAKAARERHIEIRQLDGEVADATNRLR